MPLWDFCTSDVEAGFWSGIENDNNSRIIYRNDKIVS